MISYQTEDVLHSVSRDVVTVQVQVLESGVVAQRRGDAFNVPVFKARATQHQRRHVATVVQHRRHFIDLYNQRPAVSSADRT